MKDNIKIGIIICDRYHHCAGGKCLRAIYNREGAFSIYQGGGGRIRWIHHLWRSPWWKR